MAPSAAACRPIREADYVAGNPRWNGSGRLIVVSGCSGGGKSALLAEMAARGYGVFPEPGRQIVKEQLHIGGEALPWRDATAFAERCIDRAAHFFNMAAPEHGPVFFDRSIVDAVTARERGGQTVPACCAEAVRRYRYAQQVYLVPPWRALFDADAERRHTFEEAVTEYEALLASFPAKGYSVVVLPRVPVRERADRLEAELQTAGAR